MKPNKEYKILIVDDVSKNIQILGNILSQEDYQIAWAQSGEEALSIVKVQDFHLILLDIMMPGMNGYEVCEKLKSSPITAEIPVIFLTAKADMDSIIKGFDTGGQDYITKPFNAKELLARVHTHILIREQQRELERINETLEQKVRERTEQLNEANKMLSQLDKTKSEFLAIISHELKTPLSGIIGLTHLLNQTDMGKEQAEYLKYLKTVSQRLVKFSDLALLITSLKVNKYDLDLLPVSANHIVESALVEMQDDVMDISRINFERNVSDPLIMAESELIRKAVIMVLENALKYSPETKPVNVEVVSGDGQVSFIVTDEGKGFSEEALEKLFQVFGTGDVAHQEGKGLSLSAVKLIMDAHSGDIEVKNRKPRGAEIKLVFYSRPNF
jgi:two-component system sensor histidine kinase/response regulator